MVASHCTPILAWVRFQVSMAPALNQEAGTLGHDVCVSTPPDGRLGQADRPNREKARPEDALCGVSDECRDDR